MTQPPKDCAKNTWPMVRLGDVCEVFTDGNWIESKDQSESGIRLIQTGNIGNGVFLNKEARARYVSIDTFSRLKCFEIFPGDVLISRLPEPVGRACKLVDIKERMITAVDCTVARFKPTIISDFFVCYSQSVRYNTQVADMLTGTTRARISRSNLAKVLVPLPPLTVQREIVARLEKELGEAEKVAAKFKRLAELADETFKAELDETFNTIEGEKVRLGDLCEKITKGTTPTSIGYRFVDQGVNFVKVESFSENGGVLIDKVAHISPECNNALKRSQLQADDILFSIAGAIGRVAIVAGILLPANTNQALAIIRLAKNFSLEAHYLKYALRSGVIKTQYLPMLKTTAQSNLSLQNVSDFIIPFPPLAVQREIVAKLDAAKERCEKLKTAALRGLAAAENLRKAILAEAFQ